MKIIEVVAAVIKDNDKFLITQRAKGDFKGLWEFPGGKIEPGETHEQTIVREIKEELDADIEVAKYLLTTEYDYPNFHLTMHCYLCYLKEKKITLLEHSGANWLKAEELSEYTFLPADVEVAQKIMKKSSNN